MAELRDEERLTTADIANPGPVQEVRQSDAMRGGDSLREDFRRGREDVQTDVRAGERRMEASGTPELRTSDLAARAQAAESTAGMGAATTAQQQAAPLFPEDELHNFRARWDQVQTSFVDEPRRAVEQADSLVANVVKRIAEQFAAERAELEKQWDRGEDVSTEDLRQGLRQYRAFFDRLLSV
ncbi:MAG: hypothetical protein NVSMB3_09410 [Acidobacteriaceae bacterium]